MQTSMPRLIRPSSRTKTLLPVRTIQYVLIQLEDTGLVTAQITLQNVRKHVYGNRQCLSLWQRMASCDTCAHQLSNC